MCLALPARILAIDGPTATVDVEGHVRRASLLLAPDAALDEWVLVAAGTVLRRLQTNEAAELAEMIRTATTLTERHAAARSTGGLP